MEPPKKPGSAEIYSFPGRAKVDKPIAEEPSLDTREDILRAAGILPPLRNQQPADVLPFHDPVEDMSMEEVKKRLGVIEGTKKEKYDAGLAKVLAAIADRGLKGSQPE